MGGIKSLIFLQLLYFCTCMDQLQIRYEWKQIDFEFPSPEERQEAIENGTFIPENNVPMGLEVWGDRLFITVLRWKPGVPSALNYVNLNDPSKSPKLIPYPNWSAHRNDSNGQREINAPYRMQVDRCGRLWVMDNGKVGWKNEVIVFPSVIVVIDLKTDTVLRKYTIPSDQTTSNPGFGNIAVEDEDCDDAYAYLVDYRSRALVVYSWKQNESWQIKHDSFQPDPIARDFEVNGFKYNWIDGVLGAAISGRNPDGFHTLYFHPMTSFNEFYVSTKYLLDKSGVENNPDVIKILGSRGPKGQSLSSFYDKKYGVLFYNLVNRNAVGCWRAANEVYDQSTQGIIYQSNETMAVPIDLRIDQNENIWVMSNRFYLYMYGKYDENDVNFRVFTAPVQDVIRNTVCEAPITSTTASK